MTPKTPFQKMRDNRVKAEFLKQLAIELKRHTAFEAYAKLERDFNRSCGLQQYGGKA